MECLFKKRIHENLSQSLEYDRKTYKHGLVSS